MRRTGRAGFTLIEVLVAFTILAIVLGAVFASIGASLSRERAAAAITRRALAARAVIDRVGGDIPFRFASAEGELATGERWRLRITPLAPPGEAPPPVAPEGRSQAFRVELTVEGADGRDLRLETIRLRW